MAKSDQPKQEDMSTRDKVLYTSATLFWEKGYEKTSLLEIAARAGVNRGSVFFAVKNKENLLRILVSYVLENTFSSSYLLVGKTDDPVLSYAVETALQLYMAESREEVRELAAAAYTLPTTSDLIYRKTAKRLLELFGPYNPGWQERDFYEHEIASGSIMRGCMAKPCDLYFTMERKMRLFLETTLGIYNVPEEKTKEAIQFLSGFDFEDIAKRAIQEMLGVLKTKKLTE
ncbi:MAG: TetR/AcrR family transcriptional regulator [Lachnospiraceae bacterium]|nr:TetR/AcrR family transcriptional regulator [Lachnospiraceae bacterium]